MSYRLDLIETEKCENDKDLWVACWEADKKQEWGPWTGLDIRA